MSIAFVTFPLQYRQVAAIRLDMRQAMSVTCPRARCELEEEFFLKAGVGDAPALIRQKTRFQWRQMRAARLAGTEIDGLQFQAACTASFLRGR
jgi:hypothetical protein